MIFNWISRCWGGMGISTRFEKARINCTIADWTVPYEDDILILITSFQDKNPQIPSKTAVNIFLSHLQTDEQKVHPAFLLKHLYVLDHCVQEMTALDIIGYYYNSNLTTVKSSQSIEGIDNRSPLRQLINTYYAYLITKARTFGHYEKTYFSKEAKSMQMPEVMESSSHKNAVQTRTYDDQGIPSQIGLSNDFMCSSGRKKRLKACTPEQRSIFSLFEKQTSYNSIFDVIQKCQQLQKLIMQMNKSYQTGNRKVQLIRYIFIMCLWTFIRCYVIVSVGMKYLFRHFLSMSLKQLQRFIKTFTYFNGEYTADFIRFVESNKNQIEIFKEINYNELTYVNKDGMRVLLDYKEELKLKEVANSRMKGSTKKSIEFPSTKSFSVENNSNPNYNTPDPVYPLIFNELQSQKVFQLPHEVHTKIKQNMKIFYKPRKNMDFCLMENNVNKKISEPYIYEDKFEECQMEDAFFQHMNLYHDMFMMDVSEDGGESGMYKSHVSNYTNSKQMNSSAVKSSAIKYDFSNNSPMSPKRKLSIDKDIESAITQDKSIHFADQLLNIKLTKSQLISSSTQKRSIEPIKQSQMSEIKQMFQHRRKGSRQYAAWELWENQYGEKNDLIGMKN